MYHRYARPAACSYSPDVAPSLGEGTGGAERPSDHVQDRSSEEEMHDQVIGEAERNEVEHSKEEMEDDDRGAAVEKRPRDENMDTEDDDMSEEDTSEDDTSRDEETSEEEDDGDSKELSGTALNSNSIQRS